MAKVDTSSEEKTLDLELIHSATSEIEADTQEILQAAEALPKEQAQEIINKTEQLQEIVAEIQTDLSEVRSKS